MNIRKSIIVIILFIITLGVMIELSRSELTVKLNKNENIELIEEREFEKLDREQLSKIDSKEYLILFDSENEDFIVSEKNLSRILEYLKKDYVSVSLNEIGNKDISQNYDVVFLLTNELNKYKNIEALTDYITKGGKVFFTNALDADENFYQLYRKLGIFDVGDYSKTEGFVFKDNLGVNTKGVEIVTGEFTTNFSVALEVEEDCKIYLESLSGIPVFWTKDFGNGRIAYFNGDLSNSELARGIMVGAIAELEQEFIYPVVNANVTFIDDFPAPIPYGINERVLKEFNTDTNRFYKEIWWPDMLSISKKYGLKYTGMIIGSYNGKVEHLRQHGIDIRDKDYIFFGRELLSNEGELGVHGYNHQPLLIDYKKTEEEEYYNVWNSQEDMEESLVTLKEFTDKNFPRYKFNVYVPPANILDDVGRMAIKNSFPEIRVLASLYPQNLGRENVFYFQEVEISDDGYIELPRFTSGYENSELSQWGAMNAINIHGFFSHFIHPDDVLEDERANYKSWEELAREYDELNGFIHSRYPWMRMMTASEAANEEVKYLKANIYLDENPEEYVVYCDNFHENLFLILRTDKEIFKTTNCEVKMLDDTHYLVEAKEPIFKINFKR